MQKLYFQDYIKYHIFNVVSDFWILLYIDFFLNNYQPLLFF